MLKRNILKYSILSITISIFVISTFFYLREEYFLYENKRVTNQVLKATIIGENNEKEVPEIDFTYLKEMNSSIVGYLDIPNTKIKYPVLLGEDNTYYLNHTIDHKKNPYGSIFLDYRTQNTNQVITIYGHNTDNGSMFHDLFLIKENKINLETFPFYIENKTYIVSLWKSGVIKKDVLEEIVATDNKNLLMDNSIFYNVVEYKSNPLENEKILILSTCSYEFEGARYLVVGTFS